MEYQTGTFGHDLERLRAVEGLEILQDGDAMIAVSGVYQGRVFTSSAKGMHGKSYGWFNKEVLDNGLHAERMADLGGESRLWFGPEFGEFSLCFEKGTETPHVSSGGLESRGPGHWGYRTDSRDARNIFR